MRKSKFSRHRSKSYNSPEERRKRSERARNGAIAANKAKAEKREPEPWPLDCFMTLTAENHASGKMTVLTFHPGTRRNNLLIKIDGDEWKTCGHIEAIKKILSSVYGAVS